MLWLILGGLALLLLVSGLRAFERASIATLKTFLAWVAALAGLTLTLLLVLSGRGPLAFLGLSLLYPLARDWWLARRRLGGNRGGTGAPPPRGSGRMTREEAFAVLGLRPGVSELEIQSAYRRLMRSAHPDSGGSDWLASRVNEARDVLLGRTRR